MSSSACGYVAYKYGQIPLCEMGLSQYYFKKRLGALPAPINLSKQCWSHLKEQLSVKYFFPNSNLILLYFSQWKVLNWENMRLKVLIIWSLMNRHYVNKWFSSLKQCQLRPIVRVETHKICLASSERLWWWRNKRLFLVFFCLFFSYHTIQHYLTSVCHYNA